jgi:hypothetical protein
VPQAGSRNGKRVGLHSGRVGCPRSSLVSSAEFPLVPSHSEGGSRTASRILITTQKRIEFDPTHRKQTTEVASNRNKKPLFPLLALRWTRGVPSQCNEGGEACPASSIKLRFAESGGRDRSPDTGLPASRTLLATRRNTKRQSQTCNCNKTRCKQFSGRNEIACFALFALRCSFAL